jgi:hypothetical protein
MNKPSAFQEPHVTLRNLPYICINGAAEESATQGDVLGKGQLVWVHGHPKLTASRKMSVFVEGVGIVSVDSRWLSKQIALRPERADS